MSGDVDADIWIWVYSESVAIYYFLMDDTRS
jgi:hypothetical protein